MKKIVVMYRASIGDMLLAAPVYREIKNIYPRYCRIFNEF